VLLSGASGLEPETLVQAWADSSPGAARQLAYVLRRAGHPLEMALAGERHAVVEAHDLEDAVAAK
jgi:hypothetical protein